jgi:hypothetical protein
MLGGYLAKDSTSLPQTGMFVSIAVRTGTVNKTIDHDYSMNSVWPIPVAALSKAWFCGRSFAGIAGSNLVGSMDVCHL